MSGDLREAITVMNALPDISGEDSERLRGFVKVTSREVKAVGGASAGTTLEMIGYIRELELSLSSRDREIVEVLEGLSGGFRDNDGPCWCFDSKPPHSPAYLATKALWEKVQGNNS